MAASDKSRKLGRLVTEVAAAIDPSTVSPVEFHTIEWNGFSMVATFGQGRSAAAAVRILFDVKSSQAIGLCSVCHGDLACPHARELMVIMNDNDMAEAIEKRNFTKTSFSPVGFAAKPRADAWKKRLGAFAKQFEYGVQHPPEPATFPSNRELIYVINPADYSGNDSTLTVSLATRPAGESSHPPDGQASIPSNRFFRRFNGGVRVWAASTDPLDQEIAQLVAMIQPSFGFYNYAHGNNGEYHLDLNTARPLVGRLARSGRLYLRQFEGELRDDMPLIGWLSDELFELKFEIAEKDAEQLVLGLRAVNSELTLAHGQIQSLHKQWFIDSRRRLGVLRQPIPHDRITSLLTDDPIVVPRAHANELIAEALRLPLNLGVEFVGCDDLKPQPLACTPRGRLHLKAMSYGDLLEADVLVDYDGLHVPLGKPVKELYDQTRNVIVQTDPAFHQASRTLLITMGAKFHDRDFRPRVTLTRKKMPLVVAELIRAGWHVEAEGKLYRSGTAFEMKVASGIDWFELQGKARFDQTSIDLPRLLQALQAGQQTVVLDDGTIGMIPDAWLKRFGGLTTLGTAEDGAIKFGKSQVGLLDALLAEQGDVDVDATFAAARQAVRAFDRIDPMDAPATFVGQLRPYQKLAQGWFAFLRNLGFGGCLADDMGLGKTIQVLALLEARRLEKAGPSLIVLPRSLIFNWTAEANKFAPRLRVLDQSHAQRKRGTDHLADFDLVLTTYGTPSA